MMLSATLFLAMSLGSTGGTSQAALSAERKATVLTEQQTAELRKHVLSRCRLPLSTKPKDAPWYFHYELGQALAGRGDAQRALDAFLEAVGKRAFPQHGARLYGMWFTDYVPYFEIARAHARLDNWACARNALLLSRNAREIRPDDAQFAEFRSLVAEAERRDGR